MDLAEYLKAQRDTAIDFRARAGELARRLAIIDTAIRLLSAESLTPFDDPKFEAVPHDDVVESLRYLQNHRKQVAHAAQQLSNRANKMKVQL